MSTVEVEILEAGFSKSNIAIKDIFFTVDSAQIIGLIGVNGSGKSLIIKAMLGKLPYIKGEVRICERHGKYSYVPEETSFYEGLTMQEHIELISSVCDIKELIAPDELNQLIIDLDLYDYIESSPVHFSSGMKQKLSIVLGLIKKVDFYIFDNPFNYLDEKAKHVILTALKKLKENGSAVLVASTATSMVDGLCDSYLYLHQCSIFMAAASQHIKVRCELDEEDRVDCLYHLDMRRHLL